MIVIGRSMKNCLLTPTKIAEVLLGYAYHYVVQHRVGATESVSAIVEITPLSNGRWVVSTVQAAKGCKLSADAKTAVIRRMEALGALVPVNPAQRPDAKLLENTLGIYRFGDFDLGGLENEDEIEEAA